MATRAACHPDRDHVARGLCMPCYWRAKRRGFSAEPETPVYAGPPIDPDAPCCDECARDDGPIKRLYLYEPVLYRGRRTTRGSGVVDLCRRCLARARAKAEAVRVRRVEVVA